MAFNKEFTFSPKNNEYKSLSVLRSTEDIFDTKNSPRNLLDHLVLKQERHEALINYYNATIARLKEYLGIALRQLQDQKNSMIEEIETKYKDSVKEIKKKSFIKEQELIEKLDEASLHYEQVSSIINKIETGPNDKQLLIEAEKTLKIWASEVDINKNIVFFSVPNLNFYTSEYEEYKTLSKNIKISSIISESSPFSSEESKNLKLFVPFGIPSYSSYYLLNISKPVSSKSLVSALSKYLNLSNLFLSYKDSTVALEKISNSTKELYLIIN